MLECVHFPRSVFWGFNCQFQVWRLPHFIIGHSVFDIGYSGRKLALHIGYSYLPAVPLAPHSQHNSAKLQVLFDVPTRLKLYYYTKAQIRKQ